MPNFRFILPWIILGLALAAVMFGAAPALAASPETWKVEVARAVIVQGKSASNVEKNIVALLQKKIHEKTDAAITITDENEFNVETAPFSTVIVPGSSASNSLLTTEMARGGHAFPAAAEGYKIATATHGAKKLVLIAGKDTGGVFYGIGKFLRQASYSADHTIEIAAPLNLSSSPVVGSRGPYYAIHCDNWYEHVTDKSKLAALTEEMGLWGANIIWVWFDQSMYHKGPFAAGSDSAAKWANIKTVLSTAASLGLKAGMTEIFNAGYLDQTEGPLAATKGQPPEGLFCPNARQQAARRIMRRNYDELYRDLAANGIELGAVDEGIYDRGGCQCPLCKPWIKTAVEELGPWHADIVRHFFPKAKVYVADWLLSQGEVARINAYLKTNPAWIDGIYQDDRHGWSRWKGVPARYEVHGFLEAAMIGGWSSFGGNPFPARFDRFFADMSSHGSRGAMVYSEGLFDDMNKVMSLQKCWGNYPSADILREYAQWYFDADPSQQAAVAAMVADMESEWSDILLIWRCNMLSLNTTRDVLGQLEKLEARLSPAVKSTWRWNLLRARAVLAKECFDISALQGSGYGMFRWEMDLRLNHSDLAGAQAVIDAKRSWLAQRQREYTRDMSSLCTGTYDGAMSGAYSNSIPNHSTFITGFNNGVKWAKAFDEFQRRIDGEPRRRPAPKKKQP